MKYDTDSMENDTMNIYAEEGDKVTVTEQTIKNGWKSDMEKAALYLTVGGVYTVEETDVHGFSTEVLLKEFPGIRFNSVNFIDFKEN